MENPPELSPRQLRHAFCNAIDRGDHKVVKALIETYNIDLNDNMDPPPLIRAVYQEDLELIKYFVSMGADVNMSADDSIDPRTAFLWALGLGAEEIAIYLMENNVDHTQLDAKKNNVLLWAFMENKWALVHYLVTHKKYCNPKAKNVDGDCVFDLILTLRTETFWNLPWELRPAAVWSDENPELVDEILQWSDESIF